MVTLIRWILLCQKRVRLRLALYCLLEKGLKEITGNEDDLQKLLIHEIAEIIHNADQSRTEKTGN